MKTLTIVAKKEVQTALASSWLITYAAVFALLYVFNPFDILPDVLPFIGALDDASVVTASLMLIERDLSTYRKWKVRQVNG